jgi:formylglycine-generating enzyme required for sulfatase activity
MLPGSAACRVVLALIAALPALWACAPPEAAPPSGPPGDPPPGMVWVPGGTFLMGDAGEFALAHEQPVHEVRVDGFFMDAHTVTNAEFAEFVAATGYLTLAERAPDLEELVRQLPPGSPPPEELLVPGYLVLCFARTDRAPGFLPGAPWPNLSSPKSPRQRFDGKSLRTFSG